MTLVKTSLLNAIAVIVKMLTMLGLNKILAIYVGPAGYAAIGNFQNAVQIITTFGSGAITNGVTKYTAEYGENHSEQQRLWRTAGTISILSSLVTGILIFIFRKEISIWFLKDEIFSSVFVWFSISVIFFVLNSFFLAILNGKKEIHRYIIANIGGSLFTLIVTSILAIKFGLQGALIALAIYPSFSFIVTLLLCYKTSWFKFSYLFGFPDKTITINLAKFTAMALTSAACVPISHIFIRNHLGDTLGWDAAGYWEAMWRLSSAYLMMVTTTLSLYYLPRLSELTNPQDIKQEIIQGYKIILPIAAVSGLVIFLLRDFIIGVLFTAEFSPMRSLFAWQMLGDTLKIGSWILAYLMIGKAMVKFFIITEIFFSISLYLLVLFFTSIYGLEGTTVAYAVNYAAYWVAVSFIVKDFIFIKNKKHDYH